MRSRHSRTKVAPASRRSHAGGNPQYIDRDNEFRPFAFAVRVRVYLDLHMKTRFAVQLATVLFFLFVPSVVHADSLDDLARDFWIWRAAEQPVSSDDIPRIERPSGWAPDWSPRSCGPLPQAIGRIRDALAENRRIHMAVPPPGRLPADGLGAFSRALGTGSHSELAT